MDGQVQVAVFLLLFFFNDTATTEIYTLSLHDALPICAPRAASGAPSRARTPPPRRTRSPPRRRADRKSTRLNSSHVEISYAVFCLKKKKERYRFNHTQSQKKQQQ